MKKLDENLTISWPNNQSHTQRIIFEPASPYRLRFDRDTQATNQGQTYQFSGTIRDRWDNIVTKPITITLGTLGTAQLSSDVSHNNESMLHQAAVPQQ
jgi:hypothetical protein